MIVVHIMGRLDDSDAVVSCVNIFVIQVLTFPCFLSTVLHDLVLL